MDRFVDCCPRNIVARVKKRNSAVTFSADNTCNHENNHKRRKYFADSIHSDILEVINTNKSAKETPQMKSRQMYFQMGKQSIKSNVKCDLCGMIYCNTDSDDKAHHRRFCEGILLGPQIRSTAELNILFRNSIGCIATFRADHFKSNNSLDQSFSKALEIMQQELGSTNDYIENAATIFFFIRNERICGCLVIDFVETKYLVSLHKASIENYNKDDIYAGIESELMVSSHPLNDAFIGVRLIWVATHARRLGIARAMLDTARCKFSLSSMLSKTRLAFSQPTMEGLSFAFAYTGSNHLFIYK